MEDLQREWTPEFSPLGDGAVTVRVGGDVFSERLHDRMRVYAEAVTAAAANPGFPGFVEAVAAVHTVTVYYDVYQLYIGLDKLTRAYPSLNLLKPGSLQDVVCHILQQLWQDLGEGAAAKSRQVDIPVIYGGEYGPDLEEAARLCHLQTAELIRLHSSAEYRVLMLGFVPGFPYLEGLPQQLAIPRLDTPRVAVAAGSVAIGGGHTGIYPLAVPGGWRIIGRTPLRLFRPELEQQPALLRAGDRVTFIPVSESDCLDGEGDGSGSLESGTK